MPHRARRFAAVLLLLLAGGVTTPSAAEPAIWELQGRGGSVLLLGSIHMMRESDYPLPDNVIAAYRQADQLIMELDMDDLDPLLAQSLITSMGMLDDGRSLRDVMGARDYERASRKLSPMGLELDMLAALKPWFVSITVMNLQMMSAGFQPQYGLEQFLTGLARRDNKPIEGLETMEYQLGVFDGLSEKTQTRMLLQTLDEAADLDSQLEVLTKAWRNGDQQRMARELAGSFDPYPDVYRDLVVTRNREWVDRLIEVADAGPDTLVVVGALHLVGRDSVVELLTDRGRRVERWRPGR
jgi:uncharacterized protein YbaP (TraB family)